MNDLHGVHVAMPATDYYADPVPEWSLSASGAGLLLAPSCPARYLHERQNPTPSTLDQEDGTLAHAHILGVGAQPEAYPAEVLSKSGTINTDAARAWAADVRARGNIPVKQDRLDTIIAMANALHAHPVAGRILTAGIPEATLIWPDEENGITRRGRLDMLPEKPGKRGRMVLADYKGLAVDTPIPTPTGWTTMADLREGDEVLDMHGQPCRVMHKSETHFRRCLRISFDDGSSVVCDDEHRWVTTAAREQPSVKTAVEIQNTVRKYGQRSHRIPVSKALDLPAVHLAIDPYVLGCWLGDGSHWSGQITKPDDELFRRIEARGYRVSPPVSQADRTQTRNVYGLLPKLRALALWRNKHIPRAYLRASVDQRIDLLRGLMDTDGSWNDTRTQAVFTTTDAALAAQVRELALSLGQRAVTCPYVAHGFGKTVQAYAVSFRPMGINPFALGRKADRVRLVPSIRSASRLVVSVDEVATVPTQCIEVDSPTRTYLCTEAMIPTHNTISRANGAYPAQWARAVADYGTHRQAAQYIDGVVALGLAKSAAMVYVLQERVPPYLPAVVQLDPEALEIGRLQMARAARIFAHCKAADSWPDYTADGITTVSLPHWYVQAAELELDEPTPDRRTDV